jgi:thiamine biosynthesis protein ThiI
MKTVIARYSEIGSKSGQVRSKMHQVLRERVNNRLKHEGIDFEKVSTSRGRIIVENTKAKKAAEHVADTPGIASASPCLKTCSDIDNISETAGKLEVGDTFGVETNRAGEHSFDSHEVNVEVGSHIEEETGSSVDLDNPDTWLRIDIRQDTTYVFNQRIEGVGGLPTGVNSDMAALISGGIDSPVAAFEVMRRGSSITPIYFYNKPIAAEDHIMRFEAAVRELKRYHPSKKWFYIRVDFEEVNQILMNKVERGRMVLHRALMFRVAEELAEEYGLKGIVSGEALGQKSSQTASNLKLTSRSLDTPIHRPLLTSDKNKIVERSKRLDTFELSKIDSACRSISPDNPATNLSRDDFESLKKRVGFEDLVDNAVSSSEKVRI